MPAKKKAQPTELQITKDLAGALKILLDDANETIATLEKQLAAKDKELEGAYRNATGVNASIDFLWGEIDRYRNSLMDHISWDAMLPDDLRKAVQKVRTEAYAWEHDEDEKP